MYHLGFSADDVWRVFKDAILPGVEKQNEAEYNIVRLDFGGRYQEIGMNYKELITGFDGQLDTYSVLVDLQHATRNQIVKVSCRNVVTFSEPIRFPFLFKLHVTNFQQGNLCAVIDAPVKEDETYRNMSSHFTSWSTYSDKCRGGREKFDEEWELHYAKFNKDLIPGIPTYESLLSFLFLLSNKDHNKTHKDEQPEKHIKHSFANPEDHKKGGENEDPPSDKDGNGQGGRRRKHTSSAFFFKSPVALYHWIARALDTAEMITENLLLTETWKLADGGNSLRTYVCIKEAIEAPVLMIAHGNVPGEKSLIAVSSKRLYGEGYNDRIANVTLIIQQLVHGSVPGEPPLEEHLIEASAEHFLGKGHDDGNYKRIPGVTPNNSKQLGEPPLEEPLIQANTGCDDSGKRIPDVTLVGKQLGDSSGVAPSWGKIDSLATMNTEKWSEAIEVRLIHAGTRCR
ncbi:hypothetical protein D1007_61453 [Hordeum vulgare]|nr:hypothetical protein D1007_61453 [Hordeum vulgare]